VAVTFWRGRHRVQARSVVPSHQAAPVRGTSITESGVMSKAQDSKKEGKKEPAKTLKEKKEAKKIKKDERKH
jgi:hypothetical protein